MVEYGNPITCLAMLVMTGKAVRYDNEYENHYPANRDRFVALVNERIRLLRAITHE